MSLQKIIVIVGPTASGKTDLAIELAKRYDGEIINADSRQLYQELSIGTAKPTPTELNEVPHHLFDICSPCDHCDVSLYTKYADRAIQDVLTLKHLPIVVGGTGLYVKSLLFGLCESPSQDVQLRADLENQIKEEGLAKLYQELRVVDEAAALKIHPNDEHRIVRALEVYRLTGKRMSQFHNEHQFQEPRYDYLKVGLNLERSELYDCINARVIRMIDQGLEQEVRSLMDHYPGSQSLDAIGYKEWLPYFEGTQTREQVIEAIQQNSRRFAKRQLTWFRREKDVQWFSPDDQESILATVQKYLGID